MSRVRLAAAILVAVAGFTLVVYGIWLYAPGIAYMVIGLGLMAVGALGVQVSAPPRRNDRDPLTLRRTGGQS